MDEIWCKEVNSYVVCGDRSETEGAKETEEAMFGGRIEWGHGRVKERCERADEENVLVLIWNGRVLEEVMCEANGKQSTQEVDIKCCEVGRSRRSMRILRYAGEIEVSCRSLWFVGMVIVTYQHLCLPLRHPVRQPQH